MKNVPDTYHLLKRNNIWYYHRKVPQELVPIVGKQLIKLSLGTSDKQEAKIRRSAEEIKFDAYFSECWEKLKEFPQTDKVLPLPSRSVLIQYVRAAVFSADERSKIEFENETSDDVDIVQDMRIDAEQELQILKTPGDPRRSQMVYSFGAKLLNDAGENNEALNMQLFVELVRQALIEINQRKIARYDDLFDKAYFNPLFEPTQAYSISFKDLVEKYLSAKSEEYAENAVSKKREDKVRSILLTFREIIGDETDVGSIDHSILQSVRSMLAKIPARRSTIYPKLSLADAIEQGVADGKAKLSPTTQQFYLDELRGVLNFAFLYNYLPCNPAEKIKPIKKSIISPEDRRLPWTTEQITKFFNSDFYRSCAPGAVQSYTGADRQWRFWFPLIMLFTGARPNEIAQLKVHDVRKSDLDTIYFDFTNESNSKDSMQLKTSSSRRKIPIHHTLRKIGLLDYVEHRRHLDGDDARLFPTLKPDKYGNLAWYPSKRFNEKFLPAELGQNQRQCLYSFRHSVRDALRRIDATPEVLQAIGGWAPSSKSVSSHYGDPKNPDLYKKWIDNIQYDGLDLSFLYKEVN